MYMSAVSCGRLQYIQQFPPNLRLASAHTSPVCTDECDVVRVDRLQAGRRPRASRERRLPVLALLPPAICSRRTVRLPSRPKPCPAACADRVSLGEGSPYPSERPYPERSCASRARADRVRRDAVSRLRAGSQGVGDDVVPHGQAPREPAVQEGRGAADDEGGGGPGECAADGAVSRVAQSRRCKRSKRREWPRRHSGCKRGRMRKLERADGLCRRDEGERERTRGRARRKEVP